MRRSDPELFLGLSFRRGAIAPTRKTQSVLPGAKGIAMVNTQAEILRKAIENLIDAKLQDVLVRPGGLDRLLAHRRSGVASIDIRNAERRLEQTLGEVLAMESAYGGDD
ncbi:MAG: hypothetical protein IT446_15385 [Phycisphaerales bacterium]|jgi:hypothetical protein|nr:hypothetical protein [Phycisphaerales bacterium]